MIAQTGHAVSHHSSCHRRRLLTAVLALALARRDAGLAGAAERTSIAIVPRDDGLAAPPMPAMGCVI